MTPTVPPDGTLVSLPPNYDHPFDIANPEYVNHMYLNDQSEDCVVAARAHHTIRLTWVPGGQILAIDDDEVRAEFDRESLGSEGLNLPQSLGQWQNPGWQAGHVGGRKIDGFNPVALTGNGLQPVDLASEASRDQLKTNIIGHEGVHIHLSLPPGITVHSSSTFGPGNRWSDTSGDGIKDHVILLTGYDELGPIGITWGQKQAMDWAFLRKYLVEMYWVTKSAET